VRRGGDMYLSRGVDLRHDLTHNPVSLAGFRGQEARIAEVRARSSPKLAAGCLGSNRSCPVFDSQAASNWVRSRMRIPLSAVLMVFLPYRDHTANLCGLDDAERRGAVLQAARSRPPWLHSTHWGCRMTRRSIVLVLLLSLLAVGYAGAGDLPTAKPEQGGLLSETLERIAQVLRVDVERGRIPGAVVVVARKGRVALVQAVGFRDKAAGAPMTPDAIFRLASMTKPIVTVAALSLYEEGGARPRAPG